MTSWIRTPFKKVEEKERPFFFQLSDGDTCSQFILYMYAQMYAVSLAKPLFIYDRGNSVSANYELLKETFIIAEGVQYTDSIMPASTSLSGRQVSRLLPFLTPLSVQQIKEAAQKVFQWAPSMLRDIHQNIANVVVPTNIDIGVHLSAVSDVRSIETYIIGKSKTQNPNIFVASDSPALIAEFSRRSPPSWNVFFLTPVNPTARPTQRIRVEMYKQFMTELFLLQSANQVLGSLTTSVGKFLFLTAKNFQSIDTDVFKFF